MSEIGTPREILLEQPEAVFNCTSCHRCEAVWPLNLSPADIFFETKKKMIMENQIPATVSKALDSARAFAKAGHRFPFSFYEAAETVFWPGCALAANQPGLIRKVQKIMSHHLRQKIGLILDCCSDPVFQLGDNQTTFATLQEINKRLHEEGVRQVITGCLNCHKLLSEHLQDITVVFIMEVLPPEVFQKQKTDMIYLHHPCPASRWEKIRDAAQSVVNHIYSSSKSNGDIGTSEPICCGSGGGLNSIFPRMADRYLEEIARRAKGKTVVTYCAGCQNRFLKRGIKAVHLLEFLVEAPPRQTVPSPLRQWINRLFLANSAGLWTPKSLALLVITLHVSGGVYLNQQGIFSAYVLRNLPEQYPVGAPVWGVVFSCGGILAEADNPTCRGYAV